MTILKHDRVITQTLQPHLQDSKHTESLVWSPATASGINWPTGATLTRRVFHRREVIYSLYSPYEQMKIITKRKFLIEFTLYNDEIYINFGGFVSARETY